MENTNINQIVDMFKHIYDFRNKDGQIEVYNDETFKTIIELVQTLNRSKFSEETIVNVKKIIDSEFQIYIPDSGILLSNYDHEMDWYTSKKEQYSNFYWERYRKYLLKSGWSPNVLNDLEFKSIDKMMDLLGDPNTTESFSRKGLIMGDVQSGKTSNYIGLISKAADAGYKVIVLLTGVIESLRRQTQIRVEEGFIGYDVDNRRWVGVGEEKDSSIPKSATSRSNDFVGISGDNTMVQFNGSSEPFIFITKKNPNTLRKIRDSIQRMNLKPPKRQIETSLLIIDDEADNASVNTNKKENDPTKINAEIRMLKDLFAKSTYVGFTATPFANVFIDPESQTEMLKEDLFPKDFIFSLSSPSNYFGAEKMFIEDKYDTVQEIDDFDDSFPVKHKSDWTGQTVFKSLIEALNSFLIINSIRDLREGDLKNSHRSMLINVSRFIKVHNQIEQIIDSMLGNIKNAIRYSTKHESEEYLKNSYIKSLYETYEKHYSNCYTWDQVFDNLFDATKDIQVVKITSKDPKGNLDYEKNKAKGLRVIVVGGLTLSRGITLEGLTISYLYRSTQTFDVLMQMGRWFGYRTKPVNYEDLCKVWMLESTIEYFEEITRSVMQLKNDFKKMIELKKTPVEFGIRVRNESDEMGITSSNKMRSSKKFIHVEELYGRVFETPFISSKKEDISFNYNVTLSLLSKINSYYRDSNIVATNVDTKYILDYIKDMRIHDANKIRYFEKNSIIEFIQSENYEFFDVVVINGGRQSTSGFFNGLEYKMVERTFDFLDQNTIRVNGQHYRLGGKEDTSVLLPNDVKAKIKSVDKYSSKSFMIEGRNPLLLIYGLKLKKANEEIFDMDELNRINEYTELLEDNNLVPIGIGLGIPSNSSKIGTTQTVYYINDRTKWWQLMVDKDGEEDES